MSVNQASSAPLAYTIPLAARKVGCRVQVIRDAVRDGDLLAVKLPGTDRWRIPHDALVGWLYSHAAVPSELSSKALRQAASSAREAKARKHRSSARQAAREEALKSTKATG